MTLFDAIVVGSGPAGTFAAYALRGKNVLMLDVGINAPGSTGLNDNIFRLRQKTADLFHPLIGEDFESLHNLHSKKKVSLKLKAPYTSFVIKDWEELSPVISETFEGMFSFAKGGLANSWGAGVYRFNDNDLKEFPIKASALEPWYERIAGHIGISGRNDDLEPYFGHDTGLQEPLRISRFAADFLDKYQRERSYFNGRGIFVGLPRLAVLTRDHGTRGAYKYENLEFFNTSIPAVYTPAYTLDEMIKEQSVQYMNDCLVTEYRERDNIVEVVARQLKSNTTETFRCRKLILAAGAFNTAKIVLRSNADYESRLPFFDNPMAVMPLFRIRGIGAELDCEGSSLAQLNIVYYDPLREDRIQASLYGTGGPLRSDIVFDLPLPVSAGARMLKYTSQSSGAVMLFYPGKASNGTYVKLLPDNALEVRCEEGSFGRVERILMKSFRKIGYYSAPFLWQYPKMGSGLHYAGMLPMKDEPDRYQTDSMGRLSGARNIFIADGACFSALPAKNLTFTIMANSMRIADFVRKELISA